MLTLERILRQGLFCTALATGVASAHPVGDFGSATKKAYAVCSLRMTAGLLLRDEAHAESTRQCVDSETAKAKELFGPAVRPLTGNAAAALKDYFAAWTGSMRALPNLQAGPKMLAEQADNAATSRLEELWTRVEIEAGL